MKKLAHIIRLMMVAVPVAGLLLLAGCQNTYDPEAFHVFYINEDKTGLVPVEYDLRGTALESQVEELLLEMQTNTERLDHVHAIPDTVNLQKYAINDGYLLLYFDSSYEDMEEVQEVLTRSAVVQTLVQLEEIYSVGFFVNEQPLKDAAGKVIGMMNANSFIDNPGEDMQNIQETTLTLYFASMDGKNLVKEVQNVHYNSHVSREKLIIERLLKAPTSDLAQRTLPAETQLINISVMDGICVVNFDDGFKNYNYDIAEEVVIYSIVDSLTELDTIKAVQISIDGETDMVYREKMNLSEQYTRNLSLVTDGKVTVEDVDEVAPAKGGALTNLTELTE